MLGLPLTERGRHVHRGPQKPRGIGQPVKQQRPTSLPSGCRGARPHSLGRGWPQKMQISADPAKCVQATPSTEFTLKNAIVARV